MELSAVVTGTSSGIGQAVAQALLGAGWRVTGLSRRPGPLAADGLAWLECDLADPAALSVATGRLRGRPWGALVHAAGFQRVGRLGSLDHAAGAAMWQVHVAAAQQLADALVGDLSDGGRIVLVGSRTAVGVAGKSQYAATKAALVALARSWAAELAPRQVTVNVVAPGPTETAMLSDPARAAVAPVTPPLGRRVRADEVASLVVYLLSPAGAMITGQTLTICDGTSL